MADPRLNIRITGDLADIKSALGTLSKDLQGIKKTAEGAGQRVGAGLDVAKRAAFQLGAALGAAFSVRGLAAMSDEVAEHNARLKLATRGAEEFNRAQQQTFNIAQRTRTSLKATGELYARIERSTRALNLGQAKQLQLTEAINKAAQISGGGQGAEAALFQLSQGLAAGQLRGEELNSVLEQTPRLAQAIADGMGVPIGKLRELAQEGQLTAEAVLAAIQGQAEVLDKEFRQLPATIAGGFTQIRNAFLQYMGTSPAVAAVTRAIAGALRMVADNIPVVVGLVAGLGTALAMAFAPGLLAGFMAQMKALWLLVLANPFTALAAAVTAVVVAVTAMRDEIKLGVDDATTLGDLMRVAWDDVSSGVGDALGAVRGFFAETDKAAGFTFDEMTRRAREAGEYQEAWWLKLLRTVVQIFDMIGGTIRGVMAGATRVVMSAVAAMVNNFEQLGAAVAALRSGDFAGVANAVKNNLSGWRTAGANIGKNFADGFREEVLSQSDSGLESILDGWIARAQDAARGRLAEEAGGGGGGRGGGGGGSGAAARFRADLELLRDAIARALEELDRLYEEGEIGLREYFRRKQELQTQAIDAAIAQARQELAVADNQDAQAKALVEIEKLQRDRAEIGPRIAREQAKAEEELARKLEDVRDRIAELNGDEGAGRRRALERERDELLKRFADDSGAKADISEWFDTESLSLKVQAIRSDIQRTISDLRGTEELVAAQQDAGQLAPYEAERQLQEVRARSLEQLREYRAELASIPEAMRTPEVVEAIKEVDTEMARVTANMARMRQQIADVAIGALTNFFTNLATGAKSAKEALRDFVLDFARGMAQIAAKALATYAVLSLLDAIYPGLGKATAATMSAGVQHSGGMAGSGPRRRVDPMLFAGAPRFHSGGVVGLRAGEVPAILQTGEEVLSRGDPRNVMNGGGRTGAGSGTRVINVIDPSLVQDYLDSPGGEEAILNVIGRNPGRVKQVLA